MALYSRRSLKENLRTDEVQVREYGTPASCRSLYIRKEMDIREIIQLLRPNRISLSDIERGLEEEVVKKKIGRWVIRL